MQRQNTHTTMDVEEANDENAKKITENIAPSLPAEPLLGSITTSTLAKEEKGMQIRTSARVFKKMKLEQEQDKKQEDLNHPEVSTALPNSDHVPTIAAAEKSTESEANAKGQPVRCSTRVVKKIRLDLPPAVETKPKKDEPKSEIKKEARKWSQEDKIMFFEGINEFGKDIENIQQYINAKLKKKGATEEQLRTKEHVRHFYIRTFHEVSKHVKFSDSIKRVVQELYGIINYGEMFKKLGGLNEKAYLRLNELIYRGETCIRVKGKNNRIKTPMCRALVKINQLDKEYEEVKLPNRVTVELRPKNMASYVKVQCLAQNPRLKTTLPIQKRLVALIQCLNKRWKNVDALNYEKALTSNNPATNDCVPPKENTQEKMQLLMPVLRLNPPAEAKVELPSINISEYLTRQTICLSAYESRLGLDTFTEIKLNMTKKKKPKPEAEPPKVEPIEAVKTEDIKIEEITIEEHELQVNKYEEEPDSGLADAVHDAVNTILSLQTTLDRQQSETSEPEEAPMKIENIKPEAPPEIKTPKINKEDLERIQNIRKGWTEATSASLTVGEIYLMYGSDAKLILEYSWGTDLKDEPAKPKKTAANFLEMWNESYEESWENKQRNITSSLSKLLSLAKLNYKQNTIKCPCGHVCNDKTIKNPLNIGGSNSKARRGGGGTTVVDNNNSGLTPKQQDNNILLTMLPGVPNGKPQQSSGGGLFRPPTILLPKGPVIQTPTMQQQLNSIQMLNTKIQSKRGRRPRQKPIVVERKLPLLPNNLSGHQIVRMSIISQEPPPVIPIEPKMESMEATSLSVKSEIMQQDLDLQNVITDPDEDNSISTVPSSPSRILKEEGDNEWISAEVADYSLSSLLGHLESPVKTTVNSNMASDLSLSSEVDAQLQSLMTENSMDFAASFADLAASVVSDRKF